MKPIIFLLWYFQYTYVKLFLPLMCWYDLCQFWGNEALVLWFYLEQFRPSYVSNVFPFYGTSSLHLKFKVGIIYEFI